MKTPKQKRNESHYRYAEKNLKRIPLDVQISDYEKIKTHAERMGESVNGFIKRAMRQTMAADMAESTHDPDEN